MPSASVSYHIACEVHHRIFVGDTHRVPERISDLAAPWPPSGDPESSSGNRGRSSLHDPPRWGCHGILSNTDTICENMQFCVAVTAHLVDVVIRHPGDGREAAAACPSRPGQQPSPARPPHQGWICALSPTSASAESSSARRMRVHLRPSSSPPPPCSPLPKSAAGSAGSASRRDRPGRSRRTLPAAYMCPPHRRRGRHIRERNSAETPRLLCLAPRQPMQLGVHGVKPAANPWRLSKGGIRRAPHVPRRRQRGQLVGQNTGRREQRIERRRDQRRRAAVPRQRAGRILRGRVGSGTLGGSGASAGVHANAGRRRRGPTPPAAQPTLGPARGLAMGACMLIPAPRQTAAARHGITVPAPLVIHGKVDLPGARLGQLPRVHVCSPGLQALTFGSLPDNSNAGPSSRPGARPTPAGPRPAAPPAGARDSAPTAS